MRHLWRTIGYTIRFLLVIPILACAILQLAVAMLGAGIDYLQDLQKLMTSDEKPSDPSNPIGQYL